MIKTIYLPKAIKEANEQGQKLKAQIDELSKKAVSIQATDKAISREESSTRDRLASMKKLVSEGLVFKRDEARTEVEIRRLSEELKAIEGRRSENAKAMAAVQKELDDLKKALGEYWAIEIPEPDAPRQPVVHDAMSHSMTKTIGGIKEEKPAPDSQAPHHIVTSR